MNEELMMMLTNAGPEGLDAYLMYLYAQMIFNGFFITVFFVGMWHLIRYVIKNDVK